MTFPLTTTSARIICRPVDSSLTPADVLCELACLRDPVMLESTAWHEDWGRYSVLACEPLAVLTLLGDRLEDDAGRVLAHGAEEFWRVLEQALAAVRAADRPAEAAYVPGWLGYVGYEVGRLIERLPGRAVRDTHLPDMRLGFYDAVLVYDALDKTWNLVELEFDDAPAGAGRAADALMAVLARSPAACSPAVRRSSPAPLRADYEPKSNFEPDAYRAAVRRAGDYIAAGDIFQVNLSQRFSVSDAPAPLDIYRCLRRRNPAWYAAYLAFEAQGRPCAILSSSPELFLRVRNGQIVTRPIKGTRRRTGDAAVDAAAMHDLWHSPKDNAELAMIIDLLRNDIGRVCRYGSVEVTHARELETHPTVLHLVGTVVGRLKDGVGPAALLRATLPGGSITGAPKIRAMEIIDDLEPVARGVYTGCIGTVGVDGSCEWNIAIRTVVCDGPSAYVQAGGGIVADSTLEAEYQETLDKARALLQAINESRVRREERRENER